MKAKARAGLGMVVGAWGVALSVSAAWAGPFNPDLVDAKATWVAHVDMEALQGLGLAEALRGQEGVDLGELDEVRAMLGFDPIEAVFSVTVYGMDEAGEEPIVVLLGDERIEQALERIAEEEDSDVERIAIGRGVGYRFDDWLVAIGPGGEAGRRLFVAAEGDEELRRALRVIVGDAPSYKGPGPEGDAVVFVDAAVDFDDEADLAQAGMAAGFVQSLRRVRAEVQLGEERLRVRARLVFADEQSAEAMQQMAEGFLAMARMATQQQGGGVALAGAQAAAMALLQQLRIEARGESVVVELDVPTALLEQLGEDDD